MSFQFDETILSVLKIIINDNHKIQITNLYSYIPYGIIVHDKMLEEQLLINHQEFAKTSNSIANCIGVSHYVSIR